MPFPDVFLLHCTLTNTGAAPTNFACVGKKDVVVFIFQEDTTTPAIETATRRVDLAHYVHHVRRLRIFGSKKEDMAIATGKLP